MSSLSYQDQNELYEQITEQLASGRSEPKVFGINRIKVEIAERLVAKVPVLLQKEYKDHLLMAVDLKFLELQEEIFSHDLDQHVAKSRILNIQSELVTMGVVRAERLNTPSVKNHHFRLERVEALREEQSEFGARGRVRSAAS